MKAGDADTKEFLLSFLFKILVPKWWGPSSTCGVVRDGAVEVRKIFGKGSVVEN